MIYVAMGIQSLTILYLIRLHFGLKRDGAIRAKNWVILTKELKTIDLRIAKVEKRK